MNMQFYSNNSNILNINNNKTFDNNLSFGKKLLSRMTKSNSVIINNLKEQRMNENNMINNITTNNDNNNNNNNNNE